MISELSSSLWKCKTWVMNSFQRPSAKASENLCSSFYCNFSSFWRSFYFALSFISAILFYFIWYAWGLKASTMHKKVLVVCCCCLFNDFLGNSFFFLEYIQYHLIDWRLLKFRLPVNEHGCLLTQSQFSIL